jgi:hypothetical protein
LYADPLDYRVSTSMPTLLALPHTLSHTHARVCTGCRGVQVDSVVRSLDVIRAEWYKTMGEPSGANNAVLSLTSPNYDVSMAEHHRNLTIEDVRIDGTVGRILGLGLFGAPAAQSAVVGVTLRDVSARRPLQWWPTGSKAVAGDNFLIAEAPSSIRKSKAVATAESRALSLSVPSWHDAAMSFCLCYQGWEGSANESVG